MSKTEILTLDRSAAWPAALARAGGADVYYHPAYLRALAQRDEGEPLLFYYEDEDGAAVHVTLLRPLRDLPFAHPYGERWDAITPYGYAGPAATSPTAAVKAWPAWQAYAREKGIVSEFIRFHPLLGNHEPLRGFLEVREAGETVWMDLTGDIEAGLSKSRRRDLRFAQRQGVQVERAGRDCLPVFTDMYQATMRRVAAEEYYFFDHSYFSTLAQGLEENFWLMRAQAAGRDCSYALCLRHGDLLHYHLSCTAPDAAPLRSVNLLLFETALAARRAGCRRFHLGGGYRGRDSLFEFKSHFSPARAKFHVGRADHQPAITQELADLARQAGCAGVDPDFFPPYRSGR